MNFGISEKLYPFQGAYLALPESKARMHYLDEGQGEVVLALHGNPTWSFYYRNLVGRLRNSYRVIVPDHVGCGLSDKPDDAHYSYRLEQRVADIETLVRTLGLKDITLVLHDWGGMIGLNFACRNPQLIKRIVLMNTAGFPLPKDKPFPFALHLSRTPVVGDVLLRGFNAFALTASYVACKRKPLSQTLRRAYRAPYSDWRSRRAVHRFVQDIPLGPREPSWAAVKFTDENLKTLDKVPLMIIWGEQDFIFDHHFLTEWRKRRPDAEIHSYPDAGHYILEELGDEAIDLVKDFLKRHPLSQQAPH